MKPYSVTLIPEMRADTSISARKCKGNFSISKHIEALLEEKLEQVEREVGGGIGMENTCKPMAVSFQCMKKSTTNKKKKKKKEKLEIYVKSVTAALCMTCEIFF